MEDKPDSKFNKFVKFIADKYIYIRAEIKRATFSENDTLFQVNDNKELGYQDKYVTIEQSSRDKIVTEILIQYKNLYKKKVRQSSFCRYLIIIPCIIIIAKFFGILENFATCIIQQNDISVSAMVSFVSLCLSFISLIIGLLTIITKYFFPENDEKYITEIVNSIQANDLKNRIENAKHDSKKNNPEGSSQDNNDDPINDN